MNVDSVSGVGVNYYAVQINCFAVNGHSQKKRSSRFDFGVSYYIQTADADIARVGDTRAVAPSKFTLTFSFLQSDCRLSGGASVSTDSFDSIFSFLNFDLEKLLYHFIHF
jgi:hypothetical protein